MQSGVCLLSMIPCRREPGGTSEMVTQLLFGEHYQVLESNGDWIRIRTWFDEYECWISEKQHAAVTEQVYRQLHKGARICSDMAQAITSDDGRSFPVTMGAILPHFEKNRITIGDLQFGFEGNSSDPSHKGTAQTIIQTAFLYLNAPYLWGGRSPFGIDCSGFTQMVYRLNGYKLPRDAYQQVVLGTPLSFADEGEAGDLAFFDNDEGRITHVGILLNNQEIIHASGRVKIDRFDHYGIFGGEKKKYTHHLRVIKRIL